MQREPFSSSRGLSLVIRAMRMGVGYGEEQGCLWLLGMSGSTSDEVPPDHAQVTNVGDELWIVHVVYMAVFFPSSSLQSPFNYSLFFPFDSSLFAGLGLFQSQSHNYGTATRFCLTHTNNFILDPYTAPPDFFYH